MTPDTLDLGTMMEAFGLLGATAQTAFLSQAAYGFLLVFARLGTAAMLLPGLGELWVPIRVRLAMALALTLVVMPPLFPLLPTSPLPPAAMAMAMARETLIGLFIGLCIRITAAAVMLAGTIVALQAGLANALQPGVVNPDSTALLGVFLGLLVIAWLANTGLDHLVLEAILDSYILLPPPTRGGFFPFEALTGAVVRTTAEAFAIGLKLAMPVLVASLLLNLGLGLANRFMQQLQVYFISVPLAIVLALALLGLSGPWLFYTLEGGFAQTIARLGGAD